MRRRGGSAGACRRAASSGLLFSLLFACVAPGRIVSDPEWFGPPLGPVAVPARSSKPAPAEVVEASPAVVEETPEAGTTSGGLSEESTAVTTSEAVETIHASAESPTSEEEAAPSEASPPSDRDGDGIPDEADPCPDHPKNYCTAAGPLRLEHPIVFAPAGVKLLRGKSRAALKEIVAILRAENGPPRLEIRAYMPPRGRLKRLKKLSRKRARALRRALIRRGIPPRRLVAKGMGADETPEGIQNGRIELVPLDR